MEDIKNKIEALLYAAGRAVSINEIKKICRIDDEEAIKKALQDLKIDYDNRDSSLMLVNDTDTWKIVTKESYFGVVKKLVTETELPKSLMETLAVIAWKYPIKQCDLIKVRTNKAYDHLNELERLGYISRQKHGRTKLIKLTDKFFSYFDLPPDKLKQKFSDFNQIAAAIANKEKDIESMKEDHKKQVEEAKIMQEQSEQEQKAEIEKQQKEIDLFDKSGNKVKLEQYDAELKKEPSLDVYESEIKEKPEEKVEEYEGKEAEEEPKKEEVEEETEKIETKEKEEQPEKEVEGEKIEEKKEETPEEPEKEESEEESEEEKKEEKPEEHKEELEDRFERLLNSKQKKKEDKEETVEEEPEETPEDISDEEVSEESEKKESEEESEEDSEKPF